MDNLTHTAVALFLSRIGGITVYEFDASENLCFYYAHLARYADGLREGDIVARGQVIGRTSQNVTLNFTVSGPVPETGSYVNVLVTKSFPNSLVGEMMG